MKILTMDQGTPEWLAARLGIATASRFKDILTEKTRKYSKASVGYRNELLAEWITGYPTDWGSTDFAERGKELEPEARSFYELQTDAEVRTVGFVIRDDGMVGGSPDGLIGTDGGLEIKCYGAKHHVGVMLGDDIATIGQVQGNLWICEREWWDVLAYNPAMPHRLERVYRDEAYIRDLAAAVDVFITDMLEAREKILAMGVEIRPPFGGILEVS